MRMPWTPPKPKPPKVSDAELQQIGILAQDLSRQVAWSGNLPAEEIERIQREEDARMNKAREQIRSVLDGRFATVFNDGAEAAVSQADKYSYNARSVVLYLVVLAVVLMPVVAMVIGLDPQSFGTYIAPVTGIAGTVVGYWFGTVAKKEGKQ